MSGYFSQKSDYYAFGKIFEQHAKQILTNRLGLLCRETSKEENMDGKDIVFRSSNFPTEYSIDIKSPRKENRNDDHYMSDYTWIEFRNTNNGDGSLANKEDFLGIYTLDSILIVNRKQLYDFCKPHIDESNVKDTKNGLEEYELYSRIGRDDRIFKLRFDTIKSIPGCKVINLTNDDIDYINTCIKSFNKYNKSSVNYPLLQIKKQMINKENILF